MKDFNKGGKRFGGNDRGGNDRPRFGGGNKFGGDRGSRQGGFGGGRPPVTMHSAVCDECGNKCEVPFRPTGDKPIFCNNCFGDKRDGGSNSFDRNDRGSRDSHFEKRDNRSSGSFGSVPAQNDKKIDDLKKQVELLGIKLDSMMKMIQSANVVTTKPELKSESLSSVVKKAQDKPEAPKTAKPATAAKTVKEVAAKKETAKKPAAKATTAKKVEAKKPAAKKAAPKKK